MKKNITLVKIAILLNTLSLTGYIAYNEYEKRFPQSNQLIQHVCQIVGSDQSKNVVALNCIEEQKN